ncbi:hypothetical protein [Curtobacterium pusillum]|uniref:hypothetical protein n=1 Tax=Curtobacterium pusillum TaxID=69373 RepID=UPI0031D15660
MAGISFRLLRRRKRLGLRRAHLFIIAGVVAGLQAAALVQTAVTALSAQRAHMNADPVLWATSASRFTVPQEYTVALLAGGALSIVLAAALLVLLASAPPGAALVAFAVAALAVGTWISGFVVPVGALATESSDAILTVVRWVPPLLVGCAIALRGIGSIRRFTSAIVSILVLWLGTAGVAAVVAILGRLAYRPSVTGLLGYVARVLINELGPRGEGPTLMVLVVIAVIGMTAARQILRLTPLSSRAVLNPKAVGRYH